MNCEKLHLKEALQAGMKLPYAMISSLSQMTLGRTPSQIAEADLLEARFFSKEQEIRIFFNGDALQAVRLSEDATDCCLTETYSIENRQFGSSLTVTRILNWDEDGQAYTAAVRLSDWKEANGRG